MERSLELARQEFTSTHRPKVIVRSIGATHNDHGRAGAHVVIVNSSATDGWLEQVSAKICFTESLRPGISLANLGIAPRWLAAGEHAEIAVFAQPLHSETATLNRPGEPTLWLVGRIKYKDAQVRIRETGFCRSYDLGTNRWLLQVNSEYEYDY